MTLQHFLPFLFPLPSFLGFLGVEFSPLALAWGIGGECPCCSHHTTECSLGHSCGDKHGTEYWLLSVPSWWSCPVWQSGDTAGRRDQYNESKKVFTGTLFNIMNEVWSKWDMKQCHVLYQETALGKKTNTKKDNKAKLLQRKTGVQKDLANLLRKVLWCYSLESVQLQLGGNIDGERLFMSF